MHTTCLDSLHSLCIALNLGGMSRLWLADSIGGAGVTLTKLCRSYLIVKVSTFSGLLYQNTKYSSLTNKGRVVTQFEGVRCGLDD